MRALPSIAFLVCAGGAMAATPPAHLKRLPEGVLHHGAAPRALKSVAEGGHGRLWLPGGERAFKVERVVEAGVATTRFGQVEGVGHAAITLGPEGGFGRVTDGATVWFLDYRGDEAWAVRAGEGGLEIAEFDDGALAAPRLARAGMRAAQAAAAPPLAPGGSSTVDFMGLYDPDFATRYPGTLAATRIAHFVALANQAFVDSDAKVLLRLVHTQLLPGPFDPSALVNIDDMYYGVYGGFENIQPLRKAMGADLTTFFRVHDLYARGVCGVAYFPDTLLTGVNVVIDGESGGSICDDYTFAHEVGHNLGARHNLSADPTPSAGHAFVRPGQFGTIMRSLGTGSPDRLRTLGYFSNPRIACGNRPCGTPGSEDNAGVISGNAALVAGYFPKAVAGKAAKPAPTLADSDADGLIDRIDAFPFDALRGVDRDGDGSADGDDAFPDNSTEWLDTDGGGLGDNADTDDDNDGIADVIDRFPLDAAETVDADGDHWGDAEDAFDADRREEHDGDGDGLGDRADPDDDQDGNPDVATLAGIADGELLIADGATDRILRFDGAAFGALGTLVQLAPAEVTFRSGIAASPTGEVYFVAASQLRRLDRLRSATPVLMLDTFSHAQFGAGFPTTPVMAPGGDVMIAELGRDAVATLDPGQRYPLTAFNTRRLFITGTQLNLARHPGGDIVGLDAAGGDYYRFTHSGAAGFMAQVHPSSLTNAIADQASGAIAVTSSDRLWWVDRRDGAVRSLTIEPTVTTGPLVITPPGGALSLASGPDGMLYVGLRTGGVRRYDPGSGADLGQVVSAAAAAQPYGLAWAPKLLDLDVPPVAPPTPPAPSADGASTPAFGGAPAPLPPCTTECIKGGGGGGGGGGGAVDPFALGLAVLLLVLSRRARARPAVVAPRG